MEDKDLPAPNTIKSRLEEIQLSTKKVFDGKLLQVYVDQVNLPNGSESARDWIKHPGASAIVPVFKDGTIMLLNQFRYPARKVFLEVPAGKLDPGETPDVTADRELREESGLVCDNLIKVGEFYPAIGYSDEIIHIYVAWGLQQNEQNSDEDEFLINQRVSFSKALNMIETGEITDGKTICSLTKTLFWWKKNQPFKIDFGFTLS